MVVVAAGDRATAYCVDCVATIHTRTGRLTLTPHLTSVLPDNQRNAPDDTDVATAWAAAATPSCIASAMP